jgi:hypothetical protein
MLTTERIQDIFERTVEDCELKYEGNVENINYYNMFCKAGAEDFLFKMDTEINFFSCRTKHNGNDGVMFIFSLPINDERNYRSKYISEKIMKIIEVLENTFVTIDYVRCNEVKTDKFVYLVMIKVLRE